jgi:hypothetical protein
VWCSCTFLGNVFGTQTVTFTYARELGDIKFWAKVVLKAVHPEFLYGTAWQMWELAILELQYDRWQPSTIYLAGNFLLHSQTKPVLVKYTTGPIQIRTQEQGSCQWGWSLSSCEGCLLGFPISFSVLLNSCCPPLLGPWKCKTTTCLGAHTISSNSRISCSYFKTEWGTWTVLFPK